MNLASAVTSSTKLSFCYRVASRVGRSLHPSGEIGNESDRSKAQPIKTRTRSWIAIAQEAGTGNLSVKQLAQEHKTDLVSWID